MESFNSAFYLVDLQYGVEITQDDFEELGLIAYEKIGNKITRLYKFSSDINKEDLSIQLPCNCDLIEAVTYSFEDYQRTGDLIISSDYKSLNTESYIEGRKNHQHPLYMNGKYAKFQRIEDKLYFDKNYGTVNVLYHGIYSDDEGLPFINEKEKNAIACYCAFTQKSKEGWRTNNPQLIQMAEYLKHEWQRLCQNARQPMYLDQNDMNEILDARSNWNRKLYNKSYKPV